MMIRMPNTDNYVKASLDMTRFLQDKETDIELFGWYAGTYIAIKK